jgi:hypothetical protein
MARAVEAEKEVEAMNTNNKNAADSIQALEITLAKSVMGWSLAPDRFLLGKRSWIPRWRFQPTLRLDDAFHLLAEAKAELCVIQVIEGNFSVTVKIRGRAGQATGKSGPLAITLALATALGIEQV